MEYTEFSSITSIACGNIVYLLSRSESNVRDTLYTSTLSLDLTLCIRLPFPAHFVCTRNRVVTDIRPFLYPASFAGYPINLLNKRMSNFIHNLINKYRIRVTRSRSVGKFC